MKFRRLIIALAFCSQLAMAMPTCQQTCLNAAEAAAKMIASRTPIPRIGRLEDVEGAAAYLASDASSWHSGDILVIDGGFLASYF